MNRERLMEELGDIREKLFRLYGKLYPGDGSHRVPFEVEYVQERLEVLIDRLEKDEPLPIAEPYYEEVNEIGVQK